MSATGQAPVTLARQRSTQPTTSSTTEDEACHRREARSIGNLRLHPHADRVPSMTPDEYDALLVDIEQRGIVTPIDILADGTILDGRHRWQIASTLALDEIPIRAVARDDPVDYMVRMALLRRHLSTTQRKSLAASLLVAEPDRSDRSIAQVVRLSPTTIGALRAVGEQIGDVSNLDARKDAASREQPAHKSVPATDQDLSPGAPIRVPGFPVGLRVAMYRDKFRVPKVIAHARVLARIRPDSLAGGTAPKDRTRTAQRPRETTTVLEAIAVALDEAAAT